MKYCHLNGELMELGAASLGLTDLAILRGYGIFDYFRFEQKVPLFVNAHLDRFENSASEMMLKLPYSKEEILGFVNALIESNGANRGGIRLVLTGGYSENGYKPGQSPNFFILQHPSVDYTDGEYEKGVKLITKNYRRDASSVKTTNYITPLLSRNELNSTGAVDILYNKDFMISETSRANFFIVDKNGHIATPDDHVLNGVNRRILLKIADQDYTVHERTIYVDELDNIKEAFITSTTKRIMPVTEIDGIKVGKGIVGPVFKKLYQRFLEFEDAYISEHAKN